MKDEIIKSYAQLLAQIEKRLRAAQYKVLRAVNKEIVAPSCGRPYNRTALP